MVSRSWMMLFEYQTPTYIILTMSFNIRCCIYVLNMDTVAINQYD